MLPAWTTIFTLCLCMNKSCIFNPFQIQLEVRDHSKRLRSLASNLSKYEFKLWQHLAKVAVANLKLRTWFWCPSSCSIIWKSIEANYEKVRPSFEWFSFYNNVDLTLSSTRGVLPCALSSWPAVLLRGLCVCVHIVYLHRLKWLVASLRGPATCVGPL